MRPAPALALLLFALSLSAADYPVPVEGDWLVHDFRFHTGEVLPELRLHYRTVGQPTGQAVLILHGTNASGAAFLAADFAGQLFGPGQPLDAASHYIVLPDGIGSGGSTKPSSGLRAKFPQYNYDDIVRAQYRLVTEHLGIRRLSAVIGASAGGMQAWLWGEMFPGFMDVLVPMAAEPSAIGGRNWMMRRMVIDAIRNDPAWQGGEYREQPRAFAAAQVYYAIATNGGALALYTAAPTREQADKQLNQRLSQPSANDANDVLYQMEGSRDYDPAPALEKITARVLAINSADDERNPPELGVMEAAMKRIKNGRYLLIPIGPESRGHGTLANAALWKKDLAAALKAPAVPLR